MEVLIAPYIVALIIITIRYKPAGKKYSFGDFCVIIVISIPLAILLLFLLFPIWWAIVSTKSF